MDEESINVTSKPTVGQRIAGAGGAVLVASLFLPWADVDGVNRSGWELWSATDLLLAFTGGLALVCAVVGGRIGLFRPDVSIAGATDMFGVASTALIAWMLLVDFPAGASVEAGAIAGLAGAVAVMGGTGDYSTLRGAPAFPRLH